MKILGLIDTDLVNYKVSCLTIEMPYCSFKCDKECGRPICQNSALASAAKIDISEERIIDFYINNSPFSKAVCFQGLEPFDSYDDLLRFISKFRNDYLIEDDIVIYTGYNKEEIANQLAELSKFKNIVVKFGRFIPNQSPHFDEVLGVNLASDNQYAERIS